VTINTDNRLVTNTTVSQELHLTHVHMGLGFEDLKRIIVNGFKAAFLPFHRKQALVRQVAKELATFDEEAQLLTAG
jgi:adenosine deaminase